MPQDLLSEYKCIPGKRFAYNSATKVITYSSKELTSPKGILAILHEIAHAKLNHESYKYDLEVLKMEEDAWKLARKEAYFRGVDVDEKHIDECLESYREWTSKRATCPKCKTFGLQLNSTHFECINCKANWKVNRRKDKRVMRRLIK